MTISSHLQNCLADKTKSMKQLWIIHKLGDAERLINIMTLLKPDLAIDKVNIICTEDYFSLTFAVLSNLPDELGSIGFRLRQLTRSERSVFKKHALALEGIQRSELSFGLVLEDDVGFISYEKFCKFWLKTHSSFFCKDFDILFIGTGVHLPIMGTGIVVPDHTWHKSKCADSYFIRPSVARLILEDYSLYPPFMPYDWDLSLRINRLNLAVGWLQPGLTYQGSQTGRFQSTIQQNDG